jgi:hypothetical protein
MARRELLLPLLCGLLIAAAYAHPAATAGARKMVGVYELRKGDFSVKVTNFGARLMSVVFPDSKGSCSVLGSRFLSPNCVLCPPAPPPRTLLGPFVSIHAKLN